MIIFISLILFSKFHGEVICLNDSIHIWWICLEVREVYLQKLILEGSRRSAENISYINFVSYSTSVNTFILVPSNLLNKYEAEKKQFGHDRISLLASSRRLSGNKKLTKNAKNARFLLLIFSSGSTKVLLQAGCIIKIVPF